MVMDWMIGIVAVIGLVLAGGVGQTLASKRADRLRQFDPKAGETTDQIRMTGATQAALPMHDRAFDKPR
jgi:hypothetical protein